MLRRYFSSSSASAAPRMVQQQVRGQLSLLSETSSSPTTRVVFVFRSSASELHKSLPFPVSTAALSDFKAKRQETMFLYPSVDHTKFKDQRVLLMGLGDADKVTPNVLRDATHGALSALKTKQVKDVVMHVPTLEGCKLKTNRVVELLTQASMLSNYQFDQYLTDSKDANGDRRLRLPLEKIYVDTSDDYQKVRDLWIDWGGNSWLIVSVML